MDKKVRKTFAGTLIPAAILIVLFAAILFGAITSLTAANGEAKSAPSAPESLVSAGAPRSQLELKRMFEAMSLSYTEDGLSVYEPISREYRSALDKRIASGEIPTLSVEEILFIIADSAAAYEKYDLIRFRNASDEIETEIVPFEAKQSGDKPLHVSALERIRSVTGLIELRVKLMSSPECFEVTDGGDLKYTARQVERDGGDTKSVNERSFIFGLHSNSDDYSKAVVFLPGNGSRVTLYPTPDETSLCRTKVILHTGREAGEGEKKLLLKVWNEVERSRNITPEYFYGKTSIRLFALGGRVALIDETTGAAKLLLPEDNRLSSLAIILAETGEAELYFTSTSEKSSSLWVYRSGDTSVEKLFESGDNYLAVCEPISGGYDKVSVYRAARREDENAITSVECIGEPIAEYFAG